MRGRPAPRARSDSAVTIIEYALALGFLVVGLIGTMETLDIRSREEVDRQALCVATRPVPADCLPRAVSTTTTTAPSGVTTTLPPDPVPPATASAWDNSFSESRPDGLWDAVTEIVLETQGEPPTPAVGATVQVRVNITQPAVGQTFFIECVTDATGRCELRFTVPAPDVESVAFTFNGISGIEGEGLEPDPVVLTFVNPV